MTDLINRLRAQGKLTRHYCPHKKLKTLEENAADTIEKLQAENERLKRAIQEWVDGKWIPVTERLPENDTYILSTTDGVVVPAYWHNDRFYAFTANGVCTVGGVTHWMPLPKPPKGE